jgi:hypothetical protein
MASPNFFLEPWKSDRSRVRKFAQAPIRDIAHEVSELTDRIVALRVIATMQREGRLNRLTEKLTLAAGVAQRQTVAIESRADALIAREDTIKKRTDEAFSPHETLLSEAEKGLDAVERALALVSNGDPLPDSGNSSVADRNQNGG